MSLVAVVLGVSTGLFVGGALWAAERRPRLAHCAVVFGMAAAVAFIASMVGVVA